MDDAGCERSFAGEYGIQPEQACFQTHCAGSFDYADDMDVEPPKNLIDFVNGLRHLLLQLAVWCEKNCIRLRSR